MKATVYYTDSYGRKKQKTIQVEHNEPNAIIREFIARTGEPHCRYITHVKCGRYDYQWYGTAQDAF